MLSEMEKKLNPKIEKLKNEYEILEAAEDLIIEKHGVLCPALKHLRRLSIEIYDERMRLEQGLK